MSDTTWRRAGFALLALLAFPAASTIAGAAEPAADDTGDRFILDARQLTYEGRRAGEGYFSADGRRLVFQSEREPGNPFFQIYELDLETGDTRRVSPGTGKTTCAFIRPGGREIVYGSTHHDPTSLDQQRAELERRASGTERRYDWDFDPEMELYLDPGDGGAPRRLTEAHGYDAEASISPDGSLIVFTSTRSAYERKLKRRERRLLETDPSFFAEIYVMPIDGGTPRRLTTTPGYDGGPFFTADGERVVWRRFDETGVVADVWTVRIDGTDPRQITDFDSMSWAPYPHPSGEYFIFTTNKHGFENFELFVVDSAGTRQPVRITHTPGFDGLPVFGPDGRTLAWTSSRRGGDGAQLFFAGWDHDAARAALAAAPPRETGGTER